MILASKEQRLLVFPTRFESEQDSLKGTLHVTNTRIVFQPRIGFDFVVPLADFGMAIVSPRANRFSDPQLRLTTTNGQDFVFTVPKASLNAVKHWAANVPRKEISRPTTTQDGLPILRDGHRKYFVEDDRLLAHFPGKIKTKFKAEGHFYILENRLVFTGDDGEICVLPYKCILRVGAGWRVLGQPRIVIRSELKEGRSTQVVYIEDRTTASSVLRHLQRPYETSLTALRIRTHEGTWRRNVTTDE